MQGCQQRRQRQAPVAMVAAAAAAAAAAETLALTAMEAGASLALAAAETVTADETGALDGALGHKARSASQRVYKAHSCWFSNITQTPPAVGWKLFAPALTKTTPLHQSVVRVL